MSNFFWNRSGAGREAPVLTAAQVRAAAGSLTRTKFREGYDIAEVDAMFAQVLAALDDQQRGASPSLTPDTVLNAKFLATKFRAGYDQDAVDDLLDDVVASLKAGSPGH